MEHPNSDSGAREATLRKAFRDYENGVTYNNARRAAVFSAVFMMAASSLDWIILPHKAWDFLLIRILCSTLIGFIYFRLHATGSFVRTRLLAQGIALLPTLGICTMIAITDGGNSPYYAGLNLVLVGLSLLLRWSFANTLIMILLCGACYAASVLASPADSDPRILYGNCFFLWVTSIFVLAGSWFHEKLRYSEFCLREEVDQSKQLVEKQNRKLSALDEAKTRFFANISHELRTPLTIMLGITERLAKALAVPNPNSSPAEMIQMLEQNGLRLLKLIDDLLDLVRFDTGHADVIPQPTEIKPHTEGLLKSLQHLSEQDQVTLHWACNADSNHILLDRDKFDKILLNLVINAIKFTPSGGTIDVQTTVQEGQLTLTVTDSGVGIPPDVLPRIFERFWQVDTSSTRKFQGAGIGLALVRSLAEAMNGNVEVESEPNQGTTFSVRFPTEAVTEETALSQATIDTDDGGNIAQLHRKAALSIPSKIESTATLSQTPPAPRIGTPSSNRPLVLIADDEPDIRRFLLMQLENVEVLEARDGAEAVELARQHHPQLALLDYMMPELDGVEACRQIRAHHGTRATAIIVLTARADEQTKLAALEAGANDFLTKPFSTAELALRLENQLTMARIRHEMAELNEQLRQALQQLKENEALLVQNEKLSALGRMSAGIIHEINNPLNYTNAGIHAMHTFLKVLPEEEQEDFDDILKDVREGIERVTQIITDLRQFTHGERDIQGAADLCEVLTRSKRMLSHEIDDRLQFHLSIPDAAAINGNSSQLIQVFINFLQNSIDAIRERPSSTTTEPGLINVHLEEDARHWRVSITDNGVGISPENIHHIFDPFFTSKDVGKGMGMGLSVSHQILRSHHAIVDVDSTPGKGTTFSLQFPKLDRLSKETAPSAHPSSAGQTIQLHQD